MHLYIYTYITLSQIGHEDYLTISKISHEVRAIKNNVESSTVHYVISSHLLFVSLFLVFFIVYY